MNIKITTIWTLIFSNWKNGILRKYLHVYLRKGLHQQDGMPCHEATKYVYNDRVPSAM